MKIKLDENLPARLAVALVQNGYEPEGWAGCFVVLSNHKIRIKRP